MKQIPLVLAKALNILELFLLHQNEYSLSELAELSGLNISTVNRLVLYLTKRGYLQQLERRGKYSLGTKLLDFHVVLQSRLNIKDIAMPFLTKLNQEVGESVILTNWDGLEGVTIAMIPSPHILRVVPGVGTRILLYCTAVGKAILANITEEELEKYYNGITIKRRTPNTITDLSDFNRHLRIIKREGVAFDNEETYIGVRGIASVLKDNQKKVVGSIGIVSPSPRLTQTRMRKIAPKVKFYAFEISRALGYRDE